MTKVAVLVATSNQRTHWLESRCLRSVYSQHGVDPGAVSVVVVDDNSEPAEYANVETAVSRLRLTLKLPDTALRTHVMRNARTRGHSGTGAWNTGLEFLSDHSGVRADYVAILDDDDEYEPTHLANCLAAARPDVIGVFERLAWVRAGVAQVHELTAADLKREAFFVGNPGIQGSNLFVRADALAAIGGFDEALPNTTDRDLMIRLLGHAALSGGRFAVLPSVGVRYFDHDSYRVNTDIARKHRGLDLFYAKHRVDFSDEHLRASLERAYRLFGYRGMQ